eukprot:g3332.t1
MMLNRKDVYDASGPSEKMFPPQSFSFAAAGWLKIYYWGVAKCLQVHNLATKNVRFTGSSAGALAATGLVLGTDFDQVKEMALKCVDDCHGNVMPAFQLRQYLTKVMSAILKEGDHLKVKDRVAIVVTALNIWGSNRREFREFKTLEELKQVLIASCCLTPIAGFPIKINDEWVMDGGIADFQPIFDDQTITVSPFYLSTADIKPSRYVPLWWAVYPPKREDFEWVFDLGYSDTVDWLERNNAHHRRILHHSPCFHRGGMKRFKRFKQKKPSNTTQHNNRHEDFSKVNSKNKTKSSKNNSSRKKLTNNNNAQFYLDDRHDFDRDYHEEEEEEEDTKANDDLIDLFPKLSSVSSIGSMTSIGSDSDWNGNIYDEDDYCIDERELGSPVGSSLGSPLGSSSNSSPLGSPSESPLSFPVDPSSSPLPASNASYSLGYEDSMEEEGEDYDVERDGESKGFYNNNNNRNDLRKRKTSKRKSRKKTKRSDRSLSRADNTKSPPLHQMYSSSKSCGLAACRDQLSKRRRSLLDTHTRTFARFFGYRRVHLDDIFLKPFRQRGWIQSNIALYHLATSDPTSPLTSLSRPLVLDKNARARRGTFTKGFLNDRKKNVSETQYRWMYVYGPVYGLADCIMDVRLLLRFVPFIGRRVHYHDLRLRLLEQSVVFRLAVHFL